MAANQTSPHNQMVPVPGKYAAWFGHLPVPGKYAAWFGYLPVPGKYAAWFGHRQII